MLTTPLLVRHNAWLGHGLAIMAFALAFLFRSWADQAMEGLPFVTFFLAVMATAAVAGTAPAVTCLVLSFFTVWYCFLPPYGSFRLIWPQGPIALAFFLLVAGSQTALVHRLRRATMRLEKERRISERQVADHALLYRELQHRVANGIQGVASSLMAQAGLAPEAQPALDEAAERLLGVAEVHRRLHDPELGSRMSEMLDGMLRQLLVSAGKSAVAVTVHSDAGQLPPETASLIGLIVAEAASNSIKYAFAHRFGGRLDVTLLRVVTGLRLMIEDDGPGFTATEPRMGESLGSAIMAGIAERLRGELRFGEASAGGARITVEFPQPEKG